MKIFGIALLVVGVAVLVFFLLRDSETVERSSITSYEECVAAGNPIMESFPEQCRDDEGNLFVRVLDEKEIQQMEDVTQNTDVRRRYGWDFVEKEDPETSGVITGVTLIDLEGTRHDLGDVYGSCIEDERPEQPALASISCWWAGAGTKVRVVATQLGYRAELSSIDEGSAEGEGSITTFEPIVEF